MKEYRFSEEVPSQFDFDEYASDIAFGDDQIYSDATLLDHRVNKSTTFMLVVSGTTPSYDLHIQVEIVSGGTAQIEIQTTTGITGNKYYRVTHNGAYIRAFIDNISDSGAPHTFNLDIYVKRS